MIQNPLLNENVITNQPSPYDHSQSNAVPSSQNNITNNNITYPPSSPFSARNWSSSSCDCHQDEETCWWGTWCFWLLHARTAASFDLGNSLNLSLQFWGLITIGVLLAIRLVPIAIIYFIVIGIYLAYDRARIRTGIRAKLGIYGETTQDFCTHWCCPSCAICQEAREANVANVKSLDFCSGEELSSLPHEHAAFDNNLTIGGDFMSHLQAVSKTSKIILILCGVVAVVTLIKTLVDQEYLNIAILTIIFFQPMLILYLVYWRSRRKYASLDYVIKLFAVGFWLTTYQSIVIETLLNILIAIILLPFFIAEIAHGSTLYSAPTAAPSIVQHLRHHIASYSSDFVSSIIEIIRTKSMFGYGVSAVGIYQDFIPYMNSHMLQSTTDNNQVDDKSTKDRLNLFIDNFVIIVIVLFLMAYVVAAGVEETMKHFIVRCCRFPVPLKDPHTVLVYLMSGALGFATFENIQYVFRSKQSPIPGYSLFVGELFILLIRISMPIHVICSVLQAVSVSKIILGISTMNLFQILLPAILLHGTFDFSLFLMSSIGYIYDGSSVALDVLSLVIPMIITIAGALWAYFSYKNVQRIYDSGWTLSSTTEHGVGAMQQDL